MDNATRIYVAGQARDMLDEADSVDESEVDVSEECGICHEPTGYYVTARIYVEAVHDEEDHEEDDEPVSREPLPLCCDRMPGGHTPTCDLGMALDKVLEEWKTEQESRYNAWGPCSVCGNNYHSATWHVGRPA